MQNRCRGSPPQERTVMSYILSAPSNLPVRVHCKSYVFPAAMVAKLIRTVVLAFAVLVVDRLPLAVADDSLAKSTLMTALKATSQDPRTTARPQPTHELLRRQSQSLVAYVAPDYTVGFVDGRVGMFLLPSSCVLFCRLNSSRCYSSLPGQFVYCFSWHHRRLLRRQRLHIFRLLRR